MASPVYLALAFAINWIGMVWIALAMPDHWAQSVSPDRPLRAMGAWLLRAVGVLALGASLYLCLRVDRASIATLVWLMMTTAAIQLVAWMLAWRARWLRVFIPVR